MLEANHIRSTAFFPSSLTVNKSLGQERVPFMAASEMSEGLPVLLT